MHLKELNKKNYTLSVFYIICDNDRRCLILYRNQGEPW